MNPSTASDARAQMTCVRYVCVRLKGTLARRRGRNSERRAVREARARKGPRWRRAECRPERPWVGRERRMERLGGRGVWDILW